MFGDPLGGLIPWGPLQAGGSRLRREYEARLGQPKDIAAAVCFSASPLSDFMTGTTFRIDGGATPSV
jgi:NAD(P)-dependent dehydrogenase (short-subunit alcohol dehydrogenase family)